VRGASNRERPLLLGAILAGGESRRFGRPKALAPVCGRPMAAWVAAALVPNLPRVVAIANDPAIGQALGLPVRPDRLPGAGPAGGLLTALEWAKDAGETGVFLLGGDLPLVGADMVGRILGAWPLEAQAVVPRSHGPLGLEPLCAGYAVSCLPVLERRLARGQRSLAGLVDEINAFPVPIGALGSEKEVSRAFTNVNTTAEAAWVESVLTAAAPAPGLPGRRGGDE
jgi:molybdopterin-guanine dinucleotide biosynthesis protein A